MGNFDERYWGISASAVINTLTVLGPQRNIGTDPQSQIGTDPQSQIGTDPLLTQMMSRDVLGPDHDTVRLAMVHRR